MKYFFFLIVFFTCNQGGYAQITPDSVVITFSVKDSVSQKPLQYAVVKLVVLNGNTYILGAISNNKGQCKIKTPQQLFLENDFHIEVSSVGYVSKILVPVNGQKHYEMLMLVKYDTLGTVTVTSQAPKFTREIDKLTVKIDPKNYPRNAALADITNNIPSLSIDVNENIMINGRVPAEIYLDGKLVSKQIIKALPLTIIDRIEIIEAPSAAYEGTNGIVNIITKKVSNATVYGRTSFKAGLLRRAYTPYGNLLMKSKRLFANITASMQYRVQPKLSNTERLLASNGEYNLRQEQIASDRTSFFFTTADFSYDLDSLTNVAASLYYNIIDFKSNAKANNSFKATNFLSEHLYNYGSNNFTASVELLRKLKKSASLSIVNRFFKGATPLDIENQFFYSGKKLIANRFDVEERSHSYTTQVLYNKILPRKKGEFDGGILYTITKSKSPFKTYNFDTLNSQFVLSQENTDASNYTKQVITPFFSFKVKLKKYGIRIGARNEFSTLRLKYQGNNGTEFPVIDNFNILPNILLQRSLAKSINTSLQYRRVVKRPDIEMLNQFLNGSSFGLLSSGNGFLVPEIEDRFILNFDKTSVRPKVVFFGSASLYYTKVTNPIFEAYTNQQDTNVIKKYVNLPKQNIIGVSTSTFFQFPQKGSINLTMFVENSFIPTAAINGIVSYNDNYLMWGGTISGEYQTKRFGSFNVDMSYRNREFDLQNIIEKFPVVTTSYRKQFYNNKISLLLSYVNLLGKGSNTESSFTNSTFNINNTVENRNNNVLLTLSYVFGKRIRSSIAKTAIENEDTKEKKSKIE